MLSKLHNVFEATHFYRTVLMIEKMINLTHLSNLGNKTSDVNIIRLDDEFVVERQ